MFRGREVTHPERGTALLDRLAEELSEIAAVEQSPIQDGRNMTMLLAPSKAVLAGETDHQAEDGKPEVRGKQSRRERARAEANAEASDGNAAQADDAQTDDAQANNAQANGSRSEPVASAVSEDSSN
jgi:translation initiation factor IF-3